MGEQVVTNSTVKDRLVGQNTVASPLFCQGNLRQLRLALHQALTAPSQTMQPPCRQVQDKAPSASTSSLSSSRPRWCSPSASAGPLAIGMANSAAGPGRAAGAQGATARAGLEDDGADDAPNTKQGQTGTSARCASSGWAVASPPRS